LHIGHFIKTVLQIYQVIFYIYIYIYIYMLLKLFTELIFTVFKVFRYNPLKCQ